MVWRHRKVIWKRNRPSMCMGRNQEMERQWNTCTDHAKKWANSGWGSTWRYRDKNPIPKLDLLCKGHMQKLCPKKFHGIPLAPGSLTPFLLWFAHVWKKRVKIHSSLGPKTFRDYCHPWSQSCFPLRSGSVSHPIPTGKICKSWVSYKLRQMVGSRETEKRIVGPWR